MRLDAYSRKKLANKIRDRANVINFDKYANVRTHWVAQYANGNSGACFYSFGVEHILNEIKKYICNRNIITNIYKI